MLYPEAIYGTHSTVDWLGTRAGAENLTPTRVRTQNHPTVTNRCTDYAGSVPIQILVKVVQNQAVREHLQHLFFRLYIIYRILIEFTSWIYGSSNRANTPKFLTLHTFCRMFLFIRKCQYNNSECKLLVL
jgi:hypothetical protein